MSSNGSKGVPSATSTRLDRDTIDQNHVVDRYVRGSLSDAEREQFEIYLLDHPEIVDELLYAKSMQETISTELQDPVPDRPVQEDSRQPGGFWLGRACTMAATVVFAMMFGYSAYLHTKMGTLMGDDANQSIPGPVSTILDLQPMRGGTDVGHVEVGGNSLVVTADVGYADSDSFSVVLTGVDSNYLWSKADFVADRNDRISMMFDALPQGIYRLSVISNSDGIETAAYTFFIQQPDP